MKKVVAIVLVCIVCAVGVGLFLHFNNGDNNTVHYSVAELNLEETVEAKKGERFKLIVPQVEYCTFLYYADEFGTPYTDEKGYSLKEFDPKDNPKLYAEFKGEEILVRYDFNGGTADMPEYSFVCYGEQLPELKNPTKDHASFSGWSARGSDGNEFLVHDGIRFVDRKLTLTKGSFYINNAEITLKANFEAEKVDVTCVYYKSADKYLSGVSEEKIVKIPYGTWAYDSYMPTIKSDYGQTQTFVWSLTNDFEADEFSDEIYEPITLYAIACETQYKGFFARESLDKKHLIIDFRTKGVTNIDATYTTASGAEEVIFVGNPSVTYTNFSIVISATTDDLTITFQDFNYVGKDGVVAFDAANLSSESQLKIRSRGSSSITGANGKNGANVKSYNRNSGEKHTRAKDGENGLNGTDGQVAVIANNILIEIAKNGSLSITGGNGGKGSNGGNGEGSQNDGIAQAGHGGKGGNGGKGADALKVYNKLAIKGEGALYITGGNGGAAGNGGSGGNNLDKGAFDRADNGGHGGAGGTGGHGGSGICFENSNTKGEDCYLSAVLVKGGNGGNGGKGGDGGDGGKNEFQSQGSAPGNAGNGGNGGNGGLSLYNCSFTINKQKSNGGAGGDAGSPSTTPYSGKSGKKGTGGKVGS